MASVVLNIALNSIMSCFVVNNEHNNYTKCIARFAYDKNLI